MCRCFAGRLARFPVLWVCWTVLAYGGALRAQELVTPPRNLEGGSAGMDRVVVSGTALDDDENILPNASPSSSAFGTGRDVLDTPRAVSPLSPAVIEDDQIRSLRDVQRATSDTYTPDSFGSPSLPIIRGFEGEIYDDGIRRGGSNSSFGPPLSLNAVESMDVVKGITTPVYGTSANTGGYVNLITKAAYLDADHGEINGTYGMYDYKHYQVDFGGPLIKDELGFRISFEQEDDGSYYRNSDVQSLDVYAAATWKPSARFRLDVNFEFQDVPRYPNDAGINRPTQDLIDHGTYITGVGISPYTGAIPGPLAVVTPTGTIQIDRRDVLSYSQSVGDATTYIGQIIGTYKVNDDLSITNRTYVQEYEKETISPNTFVEIVPENYTVENRTELTWKFDVPLGSPGPAQPAVPPEGKDPVAARPRLDLGNTVITGLDFRYLHSIAYDQNLTVSDSAPDLSQPLGPSRVPPSVVQRLVAVFPVPGYNQGVLAASGGYYPAYINPLNGQPGTIGGQSNATDTYQAGAFWQHNVAFTRWLALDFGGRADLLATTVTDPLPPPGFPAAGDSALVGQGQADASLTYKPASCVSVYGTFGFDELSNTALGDGYTLDPSNRLAASTFHVGTFLYEVGTKASLLDNTLFLAIAGYDQTRPYRNFDGSITEFDFRGVEFDASYQPNRNFHAFVGLSYIQAHAEDGILQSASGSVADSFNDARPDIIQGTGLGSPRLATFGPGNLRFPGTPNILFNGTMSYTLELGLGALINAVVTSDQNLDVLGTVKIPAQFELDAAVFYRKKNYEARLDVLNFTNQRNWSPVALGGYYGTEGVIPELPIRVQGTVALKF